MTTYITRRVLGLIPLLFGISIVSYALIGLAPGGAAGVFAGLQRQMTEADRQLILHNHDDTTDTYLVNDEGSVYRYQVELPTIIWGEWSEAVTELAAASMIRA